MTVRELIQLIERNCPEICYDQVTIADNLTGPEGPVVDAKYKMVNGSMVLELVVDNDKQREAKAA